MLRDGRPIKIRSELVVPGDIVILAQGDKVPADCRLFVTESNSFRIDQAILTGESESVEKDTRTVLDTKAVKQDQINMLFSVCLLMTSLIVGNDCNSGTCKGNRHWNGNVHGNWRYPHQYRLTNIRTNTSKTETG